MNRYVYLCEDSLDGIFSAIYQAYEEKHGHANNEIQIEKSDFNRELFAEYISVKTDYNKAVKVANTVKRKISYAAYDFIEKASVSAKTEKADAIYRFIIEGLCIGAAVMNHLTTSFMQTLFALERHTNNELMHLRGFLRFEELDNGILFSKINPKNAILPYLAEHFSDRFPEEDWVIADTVHETVMIHKREGCAYATMQEINFDELQLTYSKEEETMQRLWKHFVDTIAIEERTNGNLQRQMLPIRFRKYMKEFQK